ncbi:hypothetical protein [Vibrio cholerae]|uniref:hypothetical protein n=1 Tax=Vibrio cholerae TaxID=666 RepID=UPI0030808C0F
MANNVCCTVTLEEGRNWLAIDHKVWLAEVGPKNRPGSLLTELRTIFSLYWGVGCTWPSGPTRRMLSALTKEV